jgi:hypothetical protein
MKTAFRLTRALLAVAALGACSGGKFLGLALAPAATDEQVVSMLGFDAYVNTSYLRRQRLSASCENYRTFYNQVERSIRSNLPDSSRFVVDIVAARRTNLQMVKAGRSWPDKGRIEAMYRVAKDRTDSVEVRLWRSQDDRSPAEWRLPRDGPVGTKLDALGKRALAVSCPREES